MDDQVERRRTDRLKVRNGIERSTRKGWTNKLKREGGQIKGEE